MKVNVQRGKKKEARVWKVEMGEERGEGSKMTKEEEKKRARPAF